MQFGQVGVGDNVDHSSPVQVQFPLDQAFSRNFSSQKFSLFLFNFMSEVEFVWYLSSHALSSVFVYLVVFA